MRSDKLERRTKKALEQLARKKGVPGWHEMRKEQLVAALTSLTNGTNGTHKPLGAKKGFKGKLKLKPARLKVRPQRAAARNTSESPEEQVESAKYNLGVPTKDLSSKVPKDLPGGYGKDRIVVMVRDPYWLHAYWEITRHAIQRAEAAMGQEWHGARPILRLLDVSSHDTTSTSESILRDIDIHGGCNNWYIDVHNPPCSYRVDIGYLSRGPVLRPGPLQRGEHPPGRDQRRPRRELVRH
jgi:uncharacterized protein